MKRDSAKREDTGFSVHLRRIFSLLICSNARFAVLDRPTHFFQPLLTLLTPTVLSRGGRVFIAVCLLFHTMSQKPIKLGSPNLTEKCSINQSIKTNLYSALCFIMSTRKQFILGSKGQRSRSRVIKTLQALIFALLWVLDSFSFYRTLVEHHDISHPVWRRIVLLRFIIIVSFVILDRPTKIFSRNGMAFLISDGTQLA